jgi:hypothetical protein
MGNYCNASANHSQAFGERATSYLLAQQAQASGQFSSGGDAQKSLVVARRSAVLVTGESLPLSLDGSGTNNLIIPSGTNRVWNVTVRYTAVVTAVTGTATDVAVGHYMVSTLQYGFKRVASVNSITSVTTSGTHGDTSLISNGAVLTPGVNGTAMSLTWTAPTFEGGGSVTMRVLASVELTEVAW